MVFTFLESDVKNSLFLPVVNPTGHHQVILCRKTGNLKSRTKVLKAVFYSMLTSVPLSVFIKRQPGVKWLMTE